MSEPITGRRHEWKRKPNGEIDDFAWDGDDHTGPQCAACGDVFCDGCNLQRWGAVKAGTDEADCEGPHRRVWRLPDQPEVAVTDAYGLAWHPSPKYPGYWAVDMATVTAHALHDAGEDVLAWVDLLRRGPLTEVSAEYDAWLAKGGESASRD